MRNFLAFVGLIVVAFIGVGYYMGWYKFAMSPGKDGKQNINVEVDTKKIGEAGDELSGLVKDKLQKEPEPDSPEFMGPPEPKTKSTLR